VRILLRELKERETYLETPGVKTFPKESWERKLDNRPLE
jgi:hypothetical protein